MDDSKSVLIQLYVPFIIHKVNHPRPTTFLYSSSVDWLLCDHLHLGTIGDPAKKGKQVVEYKKSILTFIKYCQMFLSSMR
jgi:hypothetical protein